MRRAAVYCRISQDRSGEALGTARQETDCKALAEQLGLTVTRVFVDDDTSAYSGKKRPGYAEMMSELADHRFDAVICWHADRLHRSTKELEGYIDATEGAHVTTHTVTGGDLDLSNATGRAVARTVGAWARFESEHKAERISRKMRELAETGKFTGGVAPFGWKHRTEARLGSDGKLRERKLLELDADGRPMLDPEEAAIIREATERFLSGESIGSLTRWINSQNVLTRTGKPWKHVTLRQALKRPRNAGLATVQGEVVGPSTFPAIVSEDQWRAVVAELNRPERLTAASSRVKHLLSGLARCGTCGGKMGAASVARGDKRVLIYRCRTVTDGARQPRNGSTHPQRMIEPIDDYVSRVVTGFLEQGDVAAMLSKEKAGDVESLRSERADIRSSLDALAGEFAEGNISASQLGTASRRLNERLEAVSARLEAAATQSPLGGLAAVEGSVADWWAGLGIEHRRAVVDTLCTVTIDPVGKGMARVFHPETVRIDWKAAR